MATRRRKVYGFRESARRGRSRNPYEVREERLKRRKAEARRLEEELRASGPTLDLRDALFIASTRGQKYVVAIYRDKGRDTFTFREYTSGQGSASGTGYSLEQIKLRVRKLIQFAKLYDGINYEVYLDTLGVSP